MAVVDGRFLCAFSYSLAPSLCSPPFFPFVPLHLVEDFSSSSLSTVLDVDHHRPPSHHHDRHRRHYHQSRTHKHRLQTASQTRPSRRSRRGTGQGQRSPVVVLSLPFPADKPDNQLQGSPRLLQLQRWNTRQL